MKQLEFTDITLEFRNPSKIAFEHTVKFSDLEETLETINWLSVDKMTVTRIPVYRDPDFEDYTTRLIFNKQNIWADTQANKKYEALIYNSERI